MRLDTIFDLLKKYSTVAFIMVLCIILIILLGYYIIYRKLLHGKKQLNTKKTVLFLVSVFYLTIVLGAVFSNRNISNDYGIKQLFSSYKSAWYNCSMQEWRNIILNIFLFVPLGILTPLWSKKLNKLYFVFLIGAIISILIECTQYIFKIGVFEFDDILNNSIGVILGYYACQFYLIIKSKNATFKNIIINTFPFLFVLFTFFNIYIAYLIQPYGNLSISNYEKHNMNNTTIIHNESFSNNSNVKNIYREKEYTINNAIELSKTFFKNEKAEVDYHSYFLDNNILTLDSTNGIYHFSMNLNGGKYNFQNETLFQNNSEIPDISLSENEVREILKGFSVIPPTDSKFTVNDNSFYEFNHSVNENDDLFCNGSIYCYIFKNKILGEIDNNIVELYKYNEVENILNEKEVIDLISQGKFFSDNDIFVNCTLTISSIDTIYLCDSKNYYQPVYNVKANLMNKRFHKKVEIYIPALKT